MHFATPIGVEQLKRRWFLQPETEHAEIYRMFEPRLAIGDLGSLRASVGVARPLSIQFQALRSPRRSGPAWRGTARPP